MVSHQEKVVLRGGSEFTSCSSQGGSLGLSLQAPRLSSQHNLSLKGGERSVCSICQWAVSEAYSSSYWGAAIALSVPDPGGTWSWQALVGRVGTLVLPEDDMWRPLQMWNRVNDFAELSVQLHWVYEIYDVRTRQFRIKSLHNFPILSYIKFNK